MSYFHKRAVGYTNTVNELADPAGNECYLPYNYNDYLTHMNEDGPDLDGPKDWIVSYGSDPSSGQIIGFRCVEDDLPRNSLMQKHEKSLSNSNTTLADECSQRVQARIERILEQCDYISAMTGMSVREIREKLHEDEQQRLKNLRLENTDNGPIFYFCDPPPLSDIVNDIASSKSSDAGSYMGSDSPKHLVTKNERLYTKPSEYERESQSQQCKEIDEDIVSNCKRGISSPTDYEQDESEFKNFFSMVQRIHKKCEEVKAEGRQTKTAS